MTQSSKLKFHCPRVLPVHQVDRRKHGEGTCHFNHIVCGQNQLHGSSLIWRKALSLTHLAMKNFHSAVKISWILMVVCKTLKSYFFFLNSIHILHIHNNYHFLYWWLLFTIHKTEDSCFVINLAPGKELQQNFLVSPFKVWHHFSKGLFQWLIYSTWTNGSRV